MNQEEIKKILPHREPMLLVDEAEKISETEVSGKYLVKGDEFFLQGHFPGNPVVFFGKLPIPSSPRPWLL